MPSDAVEATNCTVNGVIQDRDGAGISKEAREADADRFKRRATRPKELPASGHSLRREARALQRKLQYEQIHEQDVEEARVKIEELLARADSVSQARGAVNELVIAWSQ